MAGAAGARAAKAALRESRWGAFSLAAGAATLRTGVQFGLQAYVPLYLWKVLHTSPGRANLVGSILLATGASQLGAGPRAAVTASVEPGTDAAHALLHLRLIIPPGLHAQSHTPGGAPGAPPAPAFGTCFLTRTLGTGGHWLPAKNAHFRLLAAVVLRT